MDNIELTDVQKLARWYMVTLRTVVQINGGHEITDDTEKITGFAFPPVSPEMSNTFFQVVSPFVNRKNWGIVRKDAVLMQHVSTKQQIEIFSIIKKIEDQDQEIDQIKKSELSKNEKVQAVANIYTQQ